MPRKRIACTICEILKYQNFALKEAKYKYQVTRYLKLAQTARNRIIKASDFENLYYCSDEHYALAADIEIKHKLLLERLSSYGKESRQRVLRELQKSAFKYAEDVIIHGINSIEAFESRIELDRRKHNLGVRKRKRALIVM